MTQGYLAGFAYGLLWFYDTTGAAIGQSSTLANGSSSGAYVMLYPKTAGLDVAAPGDLNIQGGDKDLTSIGFGNSKLNPFDLVLADIDTALIAMITGSAINTGNTSFDKFSVNPNRTTPRTFGMALIQRFQKVNGDEYFHVLFIPKVLASLRHSPFGFRAEADIVLRIRPKMTTIAHTGQTFGSAANNLAFTLEGDKTDHYSYFSQYPVHIMSQRSDAAATTFTTTYRPVSTVITLNATPNEMHKNGVATALSSIVTTTGVATLAAAGTAGDLHVLTYQTEYVPV